MLLYCRWRLEARFASLTGWPLEEYERLAETPEDELELESGGVLV